MAIIRPGSTSRGHLEAEQRMIEARERHYRLARDIARNEFDSWSQIEHEDGDGGMDGDVIAAPTFREFVHVLARAIARAEADGHRCALKKAAKIARGLTMRFGYDDRNPDAPSMIEEVAAEIERRIPLAVLGGEARKP